MLRIERLNMRLPAAYADQAQTVSNRVGKLLADMDHSGIENHSDISVPTIQIESGASVDAVASQIADAIKTTLGVN